MPSVAVISVERFHINHVASATRALICLVTFYLLTKTDAHYCQRVGKLLTNFGVYVTFRFRLMGQHLSDALCDIATLTFDLGDNGACR